MLASKQDFINSDNKLTELFSARLKEIRDERKLSQKAVSEKLGVAVSTYANWEQGRRTPSICDIYRIIEVFEIEANELFEIK